MSTKERLHQLVEQLPENAEEEAERRILELLDDMTPEDVAWLESDLSDLGDLEPYDWGPGGPPAGNPVRYVPGIGLVVEELGDNPPA